MLIAIYNRNFEEKNIELYKNAFNLFERYQIKLAVYKDFYLQLSKHIPFSKTPEVFESSEDLPAQTSFFLTFGGDGTMLDAVCFVGQTGIPIMGINLGRLGFLAAIPEDNVAQAVHSLVTGSYSIEQRSLIHLDSNIPLFGKTGFALNEFTLHRKDSSSMIKIHTFLNGAFLNTYWCDGLIVSTPTGSTGYSLSCNGPLVFPQSSSFVITPVAPHNLNIRSLVVPDSSIISFEVEGRADQYLCTLDSRMESITSDVQLAVRKEDFSISLVRPNDHNFLNTIRQKLFWGIDSRN